MSNPPFEGESSEEMFSGFLVQGLAWVEQHRDELLEIAGQRATEMRVRGASDPYRDSRVRGDLLILQNRYPDEVFGPYALPWLIDKMLKEA